MFRLTNNYWCLGLHWKQIHINIGVEEEELGDDVAYMIACSTGENLLQMPSSNAMPTCSKTLERFNESLQCCIIYPFSYEALQRYIEVLSNFKKIITLRLAEMLIDRGLLYLFQVFEDRKQKLVPWGTDGRLPLSDLDLGSGHSAYRRASLIDLYLRTKFH